MTILNVQLIGVIILLTAALRAQESPMTESVTASPESTTVNITAVKGSSSFTSSSFTPENSTAPTHPLPINQSESESDSSSLENGGYPFIKPGIHDPGLRHVKAHDGFHSLKNEKYWARWNDAFTTPKP